MFYAAAFNLYLTHCSPPTVPSTDCHSHDSTCSLNTGLHATAT